MSRFGGEALTPGIRAEELTVEAELTFGRIGQQHFQGGIIESATLDPGHGSQTSQLRPGLILSQIRSTGLLTEWDPNSTVLGVNIISGFLMQHIDLELQGTALNRYSNLLFYGGNIKTNQIVVPSTLLNDPGEFDGNEWEFEIREQLKHRFIFDDDIYGEITAPKHFEETGTTLSLLDIDNNTIVSNAEATGTLALELPLPKAGLHFVVDQIGVAGTGQEITVDTVGAAAIFIDNTDDATATVVTAAIDFNRVVFDAVKVTAGPPITYKYMVSRSALP